MASLELIIKPLKFLEAIKRLGKKKPIAKKLSSKQWAAMPTHIRERAYFTANVESMKFLNRSKKMLNDYLSGARETVTTPDGRRVTALKKASRADFVYEMQKLAKETGLGNVLPPGKDMSRDMITRMKDIASESRLNLIFDTQTQQAQAYGYYKQGQDPAILDAFPAQRFIRAEQRKEPRPLHERNKDKVKRKDDMDFWLRMNDQSIGGLGVPFGPWGFNSGMDVEDVRRDEAEKLGLIEKNEQVLPPDDTFNKGLKAAADVEPEFLEKFMDKLGMDAINEGEFVTLAERLSNIPREAPARKVKIPQVEEMVIEGLPEPEKFKLPTPSASAKKEQKRRQNLSIASYIEARKKAHPTSNRIQKLTPKKVKANIDRATKRWAEQASSFVRVKKGTLKKILEDGRFKSQHETGTSGGSLAPQYRKKIENRHFSYPMNLEPEKRPIYGYATKSKFGWTAEHLDPTLKHDSVSMYGRIRVKLKENTRERTTVTFMDSLGAEAYLPTPLNNPTHASHALHGFHGVSASVEKAMSDNPGVGYVELQVHGGVKLEDISRIYFPDDMEPSQEMIRLLKEKGIKWTVD